MHESQQLYRKHHRVYDARNAYWKSQGQRQRCISPESSLSSCDLESPNLGNVFPDDPASSSESDLHRPPDTVTWPPSGMTQRSRLTACDAELLICEGACRFEGYVEVMRDDLDLYRYYAFAGTPESENLKCPDSSASVGTTNWTSLTLEERPGTVRPWDTLEQPSMLLRFGTSPGTITMNQWAGLCNRNPPSEISVTSVVERREMDLPSILNRISLLQRGLESDAQLRNSSLYDELIYDEEPCSKPKHNVEEQIADLIKVLNHEKWIDFSKVQNQVVSGCYQTEDREVARAFFVQLLLSVELHLRIYGDHCSKDVRHNVLQQISPKVAWNIALARRWLENMSLETYPSERSCRFELPSKKRQVEALRDFAWTLKWPNMGEVELILEDTGSAEVPLEKRGPELMSWLSGLILPGSIAAWLAINSLVACDHGTGGLLSGLGNMFPNSGFQYRASTYFYSDCIVGKVMGAAKGVNQVAGWIGPCYYTPDLDRVQCLRVRQEAPIVRRLSKREVDGMQSRSSPLGSDEDYYPVADYELVLPDTRDVDFARIVKLSFLLWSEPETSVGNEPMIYNAAVTFFIDGSLWPLRLRYDVSFIEAAPCHSGPHVLFHDYVHQVIRVDQLLVQRRWGKVAADTGVSSGQEGSTSFDSSHGSSCARELEEESVLVVEAFGHPDNEVFSRAWCAHMGLSAIVADINEICMACAIRTAYAACVNILILTDGSRKEDFEEVDRQAFSKRCR